MGCCKVRFTNSIFLKYLLTMGHPGEAQAPHKVIKRVVLYPTPPLNPKDLYKMFELHLKGVSNAIRGVPGSPLPPKPIVRQERK